MSRLLDRLRAGIGRMLLPGELHLVACSGGADSLALAAGCGWHVSRGARVGAIVVDHQLQDGSAQVAQRAAQQCRELGLDPVEVITVQVGKGGGLEAAARDSRYTGLKQAAQRLGAARVFLGHTMDDQAETVLLGLARGSGSRSIAGMAETSDLYARPLLNLRRQDTLDVCRELSLEVWDDPMNELESEVYSRRVQVRHRVLPVLREVLGEHVVPALARTGEQLRLDLDFLDTCAAQALQAAGTWQPPVLSLDVTQLPDHPAVLQRVLREAALTAGALAGELSSLHIGELAQLVRAYRGQKFIELPGHKVAWRQGKTVYIGPRHTRIRQGDTTDDSVQR